jgi:oxygen-dependent protoporphyrinogen oxidase
MEDVSEPESVESLAEKARETPVVVVGGGIAGLVVALECAKVGLPVTLVEARADLGGTVRSAELGGTLVDLGADGWSTAGGGVGHLVEELGLGASVTSEDPLPAWLSGVAGGPVPLPAETVLGIPANPWHASVRRIIGWSGVWRAYLDRLRPPLTIGQERNLDRLVRGRMGDRVADRLVAPLTMGRHGLMPAEVDVEYAAPGLSTALTRTGSLAGGVAQVRAERSSGARADALRGGMGRLVDALRARGDDLGVRFLTSARVTALAPSADGWVVHVATGEEQELLAAAYVVVTTDEPAARELLSPHVPSLDAMPAGDGILDVVTLLVDDERLDERPRGGFVYAVPGTSAATAVVHSSARWPWLAEHLGAGRHVVKVHFAGGAPDSPADAGAAAASSAFGFDVEDRVVDARVDRYVTAGPPSALGNAARTRAARDAVHRVDGLEVAGAWIAGSGLAHAVPDAVDTAERIRRRALFGSTPAQ